jgi:drug/metabolite transporter (DMT)-like permease
VAPADLLLVLANVVYGTSYATTRVVLADVPPATLALARLVVAGLVLLPLARWRGYPPMDVDDRRRVAWMGILGFAGAFALANWGIARSTATNAALLIAAEPLTLVLLGPLLLGERLSRREAAGVAFGLGGALVVVLNGIPGVTTALVPHWRGDVLLLLAGVAYASYSLLGRIVLRRHPALPVTARSLVWGIPALVPLVAAEWLDGRWPAVTPVAVLGTLYLGGVITAVGYLVWNHALERVSASRAAIFLNLQPIVGVALGALLLGEPVTIFTLAGGALVLAGISITLRAAGG